MQISEKWQERLGYGLGMLVCILFPPAAIIGLVLLLIMDRKKKSKEKDIEPPKDREENVVKNPWK